MIGLYRGRSFLSRAIQWRTLSVYSHAAWISDDDGTVYEAWRHGVRHTASTNIGHTPGTVIDVFSLDLTRQQRSDLRKWFTNQLGKPYDYFAILGFAWRRNLEDPKKWFCSELVYQGCREIGIELLGGNTPAYKVSPGMLAMSPFLTHLQTIVTSDDNG